MGLIEDLRVMAIINAQHLTPKIDRNRTPEPRKSLAIGHDYAVEDIIHIMRFGSRAGVMDIIYGTCVVGNVPSLGGQFKP